MIGTGPWGRSGVFLAASLLLGLVAPRAARAEDPPPARITEIKQEQGAEITVLLDRGSDGGVSEGQTLEVVRDGQTIGYGTISVAFSDVAVATVGTVVTGASPLKKGDQVVLGARSGFPRASGGEPEPAESTRPKGRILGQREGVLVLDFGSEAGAAVGHEVSVRREDGVETGRGTIQVVDGSTSVAVLLSGEAKVGDWALSLGPVARSRPEGPIDYVALSFLGVVADLEHPTPHRAACHVGVPVRRVMPGSPAERAGVMAGDRVLAVDGGVVRDVSAIRERIEGRKSPSVRVILSRNDRIILAEVAFGR